MAEDKKQKSEAVIVEWVGTDGDQSHVREISLADWRSIDVQDQGKTVWDRRDPMTKGQAKVSPRAADFLLEVEKGFRRVEGDERAFAFRG